MTIKIGRLLLIVKLLDDDVRAQARLKRLRYEAEVATQRARQAAWDAISGSMDTDELESEEFVESD